jgi:hypothetical protein
MNDAIPVVTAAVDKAEVALPNFSRAARVWSTADWARFKTSDGKKYVTIENKNGGIVSRSIRLLEPDTRSVKQRKRDRRAARELGAIAAKAQTA